MSNQYDNSRDVPNEKLIARLEELSDAVTCGKEGLDREFTMRIPAECDRDADLVLAESARRLRELTAVKARIKELEKALGRIKQRAEAYIEADAPMQPDSSVAAIDRICAAALLKDK